jgi:hypothetical protein
VCIKTPMVCSIALIVNVGVQVPKRLSGIGSGRPKRVRGYSGIISVGFWLLLEVSFFCAR